MKRVIIKTDSSIATLQGITGEQLFEGLVLLNKQLETLGIVEVDGEMGHIDGRDHDV